MKLFERMQFQKSESNFNCVDGRHHSATRNFLRDITSEGRKNLLGQSSQSIRKKSTTPTKNKRAAEGLGDFFIHLGKLGKISLRGAS